MSEKKEEIKFAHKRFCDEDVIDLNRSRAYKVAYASCKKDSTAHTNACRLLKNAKVLAYIEEIQKNLSKLSGVTKLRNILALKDIAYSNVADLKSDWDEFKEWGDLTAAEKASISEITHTETTVGEDMTVKVVKVKTHDKTKAIAILNKMLGFDMTSTTDALKDFIFEVTQT
jgi:phage terminase small subunit